MTRRAPRLAVVAALLLTACQPNRFVTGWLPYWTGSDGRAPITNTDIASIYSEVSPFWHTANADGSITLKSSGVSLGTAVTAIRAAGLPVIPSITDSTAKDVMRGILDDSVKRANHVAKIVKVVVDNNYDGIDLDYEGFAFVDGSSTWSSTKPDWITFVRELSTALHAKGKVLSVTVPPVYVSNGVTRGYTVYAQPDIASYVDRLRLMVYDWSVGTPGPIAPMWWVNAVIAYSSSVVPVKKLQLGINAYGRHWWTKANADEVCTDSALRSADSIEMTEGPQLAEANGVTPVRDSSGELKLVWDVAVTGPRGTALAPPRWTAPTPNITTVTRSANSATYAPALRLAPAGMTTCTVRHIVYYPDATVIRQRAEAALAAGWSGVAIWAMGYEDVSMYQALGGVAAQRPNGDPTVSLDEPAVSSGTVRLTGAAYDPEFDLPSGVHVTIVRTSDSGSVFDTVVTARVERAGLPTGLGPFHGFDVSTTLAAGNYRACARPVQWGGTDAAASACRTFTVA